MNWRISLVVYFGVFCLMMATTTRADDVTYTYTGHPYTTCAGTDVCQGRFPFLSITFTYEVGDVNLAEGVGSGVDITPFLTSFSISDGTSPVGTPLVISLANAIDPLFIVATSVGGAITAWDINAGTLNCHASSSFAPVGIGGPLESLPTGDSAGCFGAGANPPFGSGNNTNDAGTWLIGTTGSNTGSGSSGGSGGSGGGSGTTPVPEPPTLPLMVVGVLAAVIFGKMRLLGRPVRV